MEFRFVARFQYTLSVAPSYTIQGYVASHSGLNFRKVLVFCLLFLWPNCLQTYKLDGTDATGWLKLPVDEELADAREASAI